MTDDNKIDVYSVTTGRKQRVPAHWLDVFAGRFRKTPLTRKQEDKLGQVDADKVAEEAAEDADRRERANRVGVLPQPAGAVGDDTTTDSTNGDQESPDNGATDTNGE